MKIRSILFLFLAVFVMPAFAAESALVSGRVLKNVEGDAVGLRVVNNGQLVYLLTTKALYVVGDSGSKVLASHRFGVAEYPLRLDLFDSNSDGQKDIFVTSFFAGIPSSYVFEFKEGSGLSIFAKDVKFFFRTLSVSGRDVLAGQVSNYEEPLVGAIYELIWDGKRFKRGDRLDIPKGTAIYQFAGPYAEGAERIWIRDGAGRMKLYEKIGKKWKTIFKSSDKYSGEVHCFHYIGLDGISERIDKPVCVSTPPIVVAPGGISLGKDVVPSEVLIVDGHSFLLGGVMLEPKTPRKGTESLLTFSEGEGLMDCKNYGPFQGYIADYFLDGTVLTIVRNSSSKYMMRIHIDQVDIGSVDCSGEM